MRNHAIVSPLFWTGETGRFLRLYPDAQRLALYLVTCPSSTMSGIYYLSMTQIEHDLALTKEGASEALRRCLEGAFCLYDPLAEVVFVIEMARFQVGEKLSKKDKRSSGVFNQLKPFVKHKFYQAFVERYSEDFHLTKVSPSEGASKPLRRGIAQDQDQDQDQEHINTPLPPKGEIDFPEPLNNDEFKSIWEDFREHRKQLKSKMTAKAEAMNLKKIARHGSTKAIELLTRSIENGWKGWDFPDRAAGGGNSSNPHGDDDPWGRGGGKFIPPTKEQLDAYDRMNGEKPK